MIQKFYRLLAKNRLQRRYKYLIEVNRLLEEYQTSRILEGGSDEFKSQARSNLVGLQKDTREYEALLNFLKTV